MPDFTRFGRSQREQAYGQALGLPTTMTLFPLVGVLTTSATAVVFYGESIWDPVALTTKLGTNPARHLGILLLAMLITLAVATLTTNVAANVVSPSYDFSNAWPKRISFRTGGLITGMIGILIMPWNLLATPELYIFVWLGFYGGPTGGIAGVIIVDYWLVRKTSTQSGRPLPAHRHLPLRPRLELVALVVAPRGRHFFALGGAYSNLNPGGTRTDRSLSTGSSRSSSSSTTTAGWSAWSCPEPCTTGSRTCSTGPGWRSRPPDLAAGSAGAKAAIGPRPLPHGGASAHRPHIPTAGRRESAQTAAGARVGA